MSTKQNTALGDYIICELRNAKIYGLVEKKHLEDKEILRPEDLNFCVS